MGAIGGGAATAVPFAAAGFGIVPLGAIALVVPFETLKELPSNTVKPAAFTTLTALKFDLVMPAIFSEASAAALPVVLRSS